MKPLYNEKRSRWQPAFLSGMLTLTLVSIKDQELRFVFKVDREL
jgi:hypothetical protein